MTGGRRLVVQGVDVDHAQFAFVARLYTNEEDEIGFCGAFVVTDRDVVTACHCVVDFESDASTLLVGVGKTLTRKSADGRLHVVERVVVNPRYNATAGVAHGHDICLLRVRDPIANATLATLDDGTYWTEETDPDDNAAYVVGHGSQTIYGPQARQLQMAHVHLHSDAFCNARFGAYGPLVKTNGCANYMMYDACSGDSGSPLILTRGGEKIVVGIVSWGIDCGGYYPGVYNRVDLRFLDDAGVRPVVVDRPYTALTTDCACATGCTSNNVSVGTDCQDCADAGVEFCYTRGACPIDGAEYSLRYPGASWRNCVAGARVPTTSSADPLPPPPGAPSAPPRSPPAADGPLWVGYGVVATGAAALVVSVCFVVVRVRRLLVEERRPVASRVNHARSVHRAHQRPA